MKCAKCDKEVAVAAVLDLVARVVFCTMDCWKASAVIEKAQTGIDEASAKSAKPFVRYL